MKSKCRFSVTFPMLFALVCALPVDADVKHTQTNPLTKITYVSDDGWQPDGFDNGVDVTAVHMIETNIIVDGKDDEIQWRSAPEVRVPLFFGKVREVSVKALYNDDEVYLRVRWPDATENREHHPWVWDSDRGQYHEGSQVEDSLLLSFEAGCEWTPSLLSGYIYDFDAWHWLAARSDPLGQALDLYGNVQDRKLGNANFGVHQSRMTQDQWQMKFTQNHDVDLNAGWNELDRVYLKQPMNRTLHIKAEPDGGRLSPPYFVTLPPPVTAPANEAQTFPQFHPVRLTGGAAEVDARGHWKDGYWTVEFRRDLVTPAKHIFDTIFNRLVQFSVHVFEETEDLSEASESGRLFLRFEEPDHLLVKK